MENRIKIFNGKVITPFRIIGVDKLKGSLAPGKDGDIVIFDDNINIRTTIIGGKVVYRK